eukprot:s1844_g1.t1
MLLCAIKRHEKHNFQHLTALGFESPPLLPSLFRHKERNLVLCSHVDDLLVCGEGGDAAWIVAELEQKSEVHNFWWNFDSFRRPGSKGAHSFSIRFQKKRCFFTSAGIVIASHKKYISELIKDRRMDNRKSKPLDISLDSLDGPELSDEEKHVFRRKVTDKEKAAFSVFRDGIPEWKIGLYIGRLWAFLTKKETSVSVITDSSSGKAFAQRFGVGQLKHIDAKFLWLQKAMKDGLLDLEPVATLLNVSDLGTKKLNRNRRAFLMFLMAIVEFSDEVGGYVPVGEQEFNEVMQRKMLSGNMKEVRRVMLETISSGTAEFQKNVSTQMVKALTCFLCNQWRKA